MKFYIIDLDHANIEKSIFRDISELYFNNSCDTERIKEDLKMKREKPINDFDILMEKLDKYEKQQYEIDRANFKAKQAERKAEEERMIVEESKERVRMVEEELKRVKEIMRMNGINIDEKTNLEEEQDKNYVNWD